VLEAVLAVKTLENIALSRILDINGSKQTTLGVAKKKLRFVNIRVNCTVQTLEPQA